MALLCAFTAAPRFVFLPLLVIGTLSDIFDGILARRFNVSTPALRRYDSITDVIYYLFILGALGRLCGPVVVQNWWAIVILLLSETAVILTCFLKFGTYPATHSWLAKTYGLCLLGGLIALLSFNAGGWAIIGLSLVALVTNAEIVVMHLIAQQPPVDVRSIFRLAKQNQKSRR